VHGFLVLGDAMKILAATDGSRAGNAAVRFASNLLGGARKGELVVLTVEPPSSASAIPAVPGGNGTGALQRAVARTLRGRSAARFVVARARHADEVPEVISRQADRLRAELIVVGSEGRESLAEWVVGGTALRLIYVARRPVTVVRAPRKRAAR
jgi:nucleotide-binding universal stress UspA family protein